MEMRGGMFRMGGMRGNLTDEEKKNLPKLTRGMLKRIFSYLKPYRLQFSIVFVTLIVTSVLGLVPPLLTKHIVDTLTEMVGSTAGKQSYIPDLILLIGLSFGATVGMNLIGVL